MDKVKHAPMTYEEFDDWKNVVKCGWLECAGGMGLAGNGSCSFRGDFTNPNCPNFITDEDYEKEMMQRE